jgi:hypothetical protein
LKYIKGTHNVVADARSRLDMNKTPFEDTKESILGLMECFAKEKESDDEFHPLNYQHRKIAQEKGQNNPENP